MKFDDLIRTTGDGKEVVMKVEDFARLLAYVNRLKEANEKLNEQIRAYNAKFADQNTEEHY
jgi:uncharacterized protein YlxW (UPF0749 family)